MYKTVAEHRGIKLPYLGMLLDYSVPGEVKSTMQKYIDDVLELAKVCGQALTLATLHLFDMGEEAAVLSADEKQLFHYLVAKLYYLSKRAPRTS